MAAPGSDQYTGSVIPILSKDTGVYLRDVHDHTTIIDTVELLQEMLSETLDLHLSSVSNQLNKVMKVLTIIAAIFIPLTFLAGHGMNFKYMPGWNGAGGTRSSGGHGGEVYARRVQTRNGSELCCLDIRVRV
jgi:Mg2+ and Co2+ transporter CorA